MTRNGNQSLWNRNFILLWQGQFVSAIGDVVYEIALGFWVLAVTGSTGLMGTLMAASTIPRVLLSPIGGVVVDRSDRKWLLVVMDLLRGVAVLGVAVAAILGVVKVWMVFVAGVIIGIGAAFFNPTVGSVVPDIIAREKIVRANSFFSMIHAGSGVVGNSLGGVLYAGLGAPLMFLVNGCSYLFSAFTELFIRVPRIHQKEKRSFGEDIREGYAYVWHTRGLRFLMLAAGVINFLAMIGIVLLIPFFERTPFLGPAKYGIALSVMTVGMIAGMAATASIKIPAERRLLVFGTSTVGFVAPFAVFPLMPTFWPMLVLIAVGGFCNAIVNVLISSVLQLTVPQQMRGKVFGLLETVTQGLTPIGFAVGGLLGEFLPVRLVISGAFVLIGIFIFPQLAAKQLREYFAMDAEMDTETETSQASDESEKS